MKKAIFFISTVLFSQITFGQKTLTLQDSIANYFNEIKVATKKNQQLWNKNLYGALLFVNPASRQLYSNTSDSVEILKADNKIYSGVLPNNVNIANTSLHWSGKDWAMIMLPLRQTNKTELI